MRRGLLQDLANTLCQMAASANCPQDYELLAALPDGTVLFNLLAPSAWHSSGEHLELEAVKQLSNWLNARLAAEEPNRPRLDRAEVELSYRTDRIRTDREKLVSFDFQCGSVLGAPIGQFRGGPVTRHVYHQRVVA